MCPGADNTANGHTNGNGTTDANGKGTVFTSIFTSSIMLSLNQANIPVNSEPRWLHRH